MEAELKGKADEKAKLEFKAKEFEVSQPVLAVLAVPFILEQTRLEPEEQARFEPEGQARFEPEEQASLDPEEQARLEPEEPASLEPEEQARLVPEERARFEPEEQARFPELLKQMTKAFEVTLTILAIIAVVFSIYAAVLYLKSSPGRAMADQITNIQKSLCENFYKEELGLVNLEPWNEGDKNSENRRYIQDVYINQVFYNDKNRYTSLLDFFTMKSTENPKRLLLVAEQGAGKTTAIKAMAAKWCRIITSEPKYRYILTFKYAIEHLYNQGWIGNFKYTFDNPLPELIFAFELRNIYQFKNLTEAIIREVINIDENISVKEGDIEKIFERGMKNILFAFDGYDEYIKLKSEGTTMTEIDSIIHRELRKNVNLIVTTRSWRSDELLTVRRFGFQKISVGLFELPKDRDTFIRNFFPGASGEELINALEDNEEEIIPKKLQKEPRMLLYICNLWKHSKEIRKSKLKNIHMFWDGIWNMMRLTYNRKYPHQEMSKSDMELTRRKVGHLALQNRGKEMTFEHFFAEFGDELGADLFWFGIYGTESLTEKPWELLDNKEETKESKDVKGNYDSMIEQEAKKLKKEQEAEKLKKGQSEGFVALISNAIASFLWNLFWYLLSFFWNLFWLLIIPFICFLITGTAYENHIRFIDHEWLKNSIILLICLICVYISATFLKYLWPILYWNSS